MKYIDLLELAMGATIEAQMAESSCKSESGVDQNHWHACWKYVVWILLQVTQD